MTLQKFKLRTNNVTKATKKDLPQQKQSQGSFKETLLTYLKEVKAEWYKITWPERRQVIMESVVVLVVVFFFTLLVYILDMIFKGLLGLIPGR